MQTEQNIQDRELIDEESRVSCLACHREQDHCEADCVEGKGRTPGQIAQAEQDQVEARAQFDTLGFIMDYESGELDHDEVIEGFQHLVDSGMAWTLQGHYGRTAADLIRAGYVEANTDIARAIAEQGERHSAGNAVILVVMALFGATVLAITLASVGY